MNKRKLKQLRQLNNRQRPQQMWPFHAAIKKWFKTYPLAKVWARRKVPIEELKFGIDFGYIPDRTVVMGTPLMEDVFVGTMNEFKVRTKVEVK